MTFLPCAGSVKLSTTFGIAAYLRPPSAHLQLPQALPDHRLTKQILATDANAAQPEPMHGPGSHPQNRRGLGPRE